ncbi:MAG: hypothetical protein WC989_07165 [Micavibrio sp.]
MTKFVKFIPVLAVLAVAACASGHAETQGTYQADRTFERAQTK